MRARRPARLGRLGGSARGRVPAAGARRRRRRDRLARRPAVVYRARRHDRQVVGRVQRAAARRLATAGTRVRRQRVLDRRPLRGRHPLHGRMCLRRGLALVGDDDARLHGSTARSADRSERPGASAGSSGSTAAARSRTSGWPTSAATRSGVTGRSATTPARSSATSRWSGGSPIPTAVPCCGCWRRRRTASEDCSGPWAHVYPHVGAPGPAIGFLQRCVSVFDRHLRDGDGDDDREPALRAFMPERVEPGSEPDVRPGRWVAEAAWPPADRPPWRLWLGPGTLQDDVGAEHELGARRDARARRRRRDVARLGGPRRLGRPTSAPRTAAASSSTRNRWPSAPRSSASPSSWSPSFRATRPASSSHACATSRRAAHRRSSRSASST